MVMKLEMTEKNDKDSGPPQKLDSMKGEKISYCEESDEPQVIYRGWKVMPYVIGNETFEKLGTLGTSSNLLVYLITVFHMKSVTAATLLQIFNGTTNLTPVLGAFISDTYLGRYLTLGLASVASLMGMLILTLTAAFRSLHPPPCNANHQCTGASPLHLTFIFLSFAFLVIGAGGIRPCNLAFGADQFNPKTKSGRQGINSFFNWYFFTFTVAMMISSTVIIYVQTNISWTIGLGIPAVLMFFSCAFFFLGTNLYVRVKPEGSPFSTVVRVLVAAYQKRKLPLPGKEKSGSLFNPPLVGNTIRSRLPHSDQFRCLDKASVIKSSDEVQPDGKASNPWRFCSLQHVEEVKCIFRILPVWFAGMLYSMTLTQQGTYVVFQALQSNRYLGETSFQIPAGSFVVFNMLALTLWIPIYDRIIVPRLQRLTGIEGGITLLQRMGVGFIIGVVALLIAAFVEAKRRSMARPGLEDNVSPMSSLWLIPQLMLCGLSEAFSVIAQVEFYYKQFPENMRSVAGAFLFLSMALSNYICSFIVMIVHRTTGGHGKENWLASDLNNGRLDLFYVVTAAMGLANFGYFVACAKWYRYKDLKAGEAEVSMGASKGSNGGLV